MTMTVWAGHFSAGDIARLVEEELGISEHVSFAWGEVLHRFTAGVAPLVRVVVSRLKRSVAGGAELPFQYVELVEREVNSHIGIAFDEQISALDEKGLESLYYVCEADRTSGRLSVELFSALLGSHASRCLDELIARELCSFNGIDITPRCDALRDYVLAEIDEAKARAWLGKLVRTAVRLESHDLHAAISYLAAAAQKNIMPFEEIIDILSRLVGRRWRAFLSRGVAPAGRLARIIGNKLAKQKPLLYVKLSLLDASLFADPERAEQLKEFCERRCPKNPHIAAATGYVLSLAYAYRGEREMASRILAQTIAQLAKNKTKMGRKERALFYINLLAVHLYTLEQRYPHRAFHHARLAERICLLAERLGMPAPLRFQLELIASHFCSLVPDIGRSAHHLQNAVDLARRAKFYEGYVHAVLQLAYVWALEGNSKAALELLVEAEDFRRWASTPRVNVGAWRASTLGALGLWNEAKVCFAAALRDERQVKVQREVWTYQLAKCLTLLGEWRAAMDFLPLLPEPTRDKAMAQALAYDPGANHRALLEKIKSVKDYGSVIDKKIAAEAEAKLLARLGRFDEVLEVFEQLESFGPGLVPKLETLNLIIFLLQTGLSPRKKEHLSRFVELASEAVTVLSTDPGYRQPYVLQELAAKSRTALGRWLSRMLGKFSFLRVAESPYDVKVFILGDWRIEDPRRGVSIGPDVLRGEKTRAIFAELVAGYLWGVNLTADTIAYNVWGEMEMKKLYNNFHVNMSRLRKYTSAVNDELIVYDGQYYSLNHNLSIYIDALDFIDSCAEGDRLVKEGKLQEAVETYKKALAVVAGPAFPKVYSDTAEQMRYQIEFLLAKVFNKMLDALDALGMYVERERLMLRWRNREPIKSMLSQRGI